MSIVEMYRRHLIALVRQRQSVLLDRIVQCYLMKMEQTHNLNSARILQIDDQVIIQVCCTLRMVSILKYAFHYLFRFIRINCQWYLTVYVISDFETELYAEKKTCTTTPVSKGRLDSVESCRAVCKGVASMFSFGTNDHGGNICHSNECPCYCEQAQLVGGTCTTTYNIKYNLYRYLNEGVYVTYYFHSYFD